MIGIDTKRVALLIDEFDTDINDHWDKVNKRLDNLSKAETDNSMRDYVKLLQSKGKEIITASVEKIELWRGEFDKILKIDPDNKDQKEFKERVLKALGYSELRASFYPKYFRKLSISVCVYCNAHLCLTVEKDNKELLAKFQVDHYVSKNRYPCFSIALFNLYPACASCNHIKGTHSVSFKLYCESPITCSYSFKIEDVEKTVPLYLTHHNPEVIKIKFKEDDPPKGHKAMNEVFSIEQVYNLQVDIVEELILKKHIYDPSYRQTLLDNYRDLFPSASILNRFIVGNYIELEEIHNRPLSKFMQDIAKQLKLIE